MKKHLIVILLLLSTTSTFCQEAKLQIYLCSRLTNAAKQWNNTICEELYSEFSLFRPQDIDFNDIPTLSLDKEAYKADFQGMQQSDLLLVLPAYGRDCAWEIGWFCGKEKPAFAYAESYDGDWLCDAMVKGGLSAIITNNTALYNLLLNDPATSTKCYLIPSKRDLGRLIKEIYYQKKHVSETAARD